MSKQFGAIPSKFTYLLNAFEQAAQSKTPFEAKYA
jgi:hypothetical protein